MSNVKLHIILADDDHDDCFLFDDALKELGIGFELMLVHDGDHLMSHLSGSPQLPDILFLDLNMPRKTGFECLSEIKTSDKLKDVPVVIYSTSMDADAANLLYHKGASLFIRKPNQFSQIKDVLRQSLAFVERNKIAQPPRDKFIVTTSSGI
ncbi:response regulator [Chitinophaga sp. GCM10012297]|uniref:Response regulator n=1 Tax=Chitinophaga chungangae TaxID=2821488 RepID=A0ABS3Y9G5_9BACT|nr:response regulator [Chitinophaga chungangae]MBO9151309.1 response regulator [Chitinophaga chungangae]